MPFLHYCRGIRFFFFISRRQQEQYVQTAGREPLTHTKKGITLIVYICKITNLNLY